MTEWKFDETFVVVLQNTETGNFVVNPTIKNDEEYVITIISHLGPKQKLRNLFKVNYKGETIPFKDLQLSPKLQAKIKEVTK